jgi:hypothetical protein
MPLHRSGSVHLATSALVIACALTASAQVAPVAVTTYHYDNKRTGVESQRNHTDSGQRGYRLLRPTSHRHTR